MSAPFDSSPSLSKEEWKEMKHLLSAISFSPSSVAPQKLERFSSLFARSLIGKGDLPLE
jgi:hypothetical protein